MSEGTHWKKLTNPNYLGSWDFAAGEERLLTIDRVLQEQVIDMENIKKDMNAKKPCIVAHFREASKPMILNKTNCKTMQGLYNTPIIEEWAGRQIIVKVEKVRAFGKLEDALRIKNEKPAPAQTSSPPKSIICAECEKPIEPIGDYTAEQVAALNKRRHGVDLCGVCSGKRKEAKTNESNA